MLIKNHLCGSFSRPLAAGVVPRGQGVEAEIMAPPGGETHLNPMDAALDG